jgi:hypothetical protein
MNGTMNITPGICRVSGNSSWAYCEIYAEAQLYGYAFWIDYTAATANFIGYLGGSAPYLTDQSIYNQTVWLGAGYTHYAKGTSGPISASGRIALSYKLATGMVKGHKYAVEIELEGIADAEVFTHLNGGRVTLTGASASIGFNFATLGNGFVLTSIAES